MGIPGEVLEAQSEVAFFFFEGALLIWVPEVRETRPDLHPPSLPPSLQVVARELGADKLEARAAVSVALLDDNDNAPDFAREKYGVRVRENVRPGTVILKVQLDLTHTHTHPTRHFWRETLLSRPDILERDVCPRPDVYLFFEEIDPLFKVKRYLASRPDIFGGMRPPTSRVRRGAFCPNRHF